MTKETHQRWELRHARNVVMGRGINYSVRLAPRLAVNFDHSENFAKRSSCEIEERGPIRSHL